MAERINEHDMTKRMMDVMRGNYRNLLREADEETEDPTSEPAEQTDTDGVNPPPVEDSDGDGIIKLTQGDAAFNDELTQMRDIVDKTVVFTDFNIYPSDRNVVIDGYMQKQEGDDTGVFFKMAITSSDIKISMVDVELDDKVNEALQRLKGYYDKFKDDWGGRVNDEYQQGSEDAE